MLTEPSAQTLLKSNTRSAAMTRAPGVLPTHPISTAEKEMARVHITFLYATARWAPRRPSLPRDRPRQSSKLTNTHGEKR